jgi:hypothetical protein
VERCAKATKVNGVEFEVVTERVWRLPEPGGTTEVQIGLKFTNCEHDKVWFDLRNSISVRMRRRGGEWLECDGGRDAPRNKRPQDRASPILRKGESYTFVNPDSKLRWVADELRLYLVDLPRDDLYLRHVTPGTYQVEITYHAHPSMNDGADKWVGEAKTGPYEVVLARKGP